MNKASWCNAGYIVATLILAWIIGSRVAEWLPDSGWLVAFTAVLTCAIAAVVYQGIMAAIQRTPIVHTAEREQH